MKAAVSVWKSNPENQAAVLEILQDMYDDTEDVKGCIGVFNIVDYEQNLFGHISVWETQKDIDDFYQKREPDNPNAIGDLMNLVSEMKVMNIFDVVEYK
jgi:hypothetical protein